MQRIVFMAYAFTLATVQVGGSCDEAFLQCSEHAGSGEEPDSKQRRLNLIKAVEGDDWSAVIDSQTQQTIEGGVALTLMLR